MPTAWGLAGKLSGQVATGDLDSMMSKLSDWEPTWEMDRGCRSHKSVIGLQVPVIREDGSKARDTVICTITEPTLEELQYVPLLS